MSLCFKPNVIHEKNFFFGDFLGDSKFLEDNLSGEFYLELFEDTNKPMLTNNIENDQNYLDNQLIFQQDGAPTHNALPVRFRTTLPTSLHDHQTCLLQISSCEGIWKPLFDLKFYDN